MTTGECGYHGEDCGDVHSYINSLTNTSSISDTGLQSREQERAEELLIKLISRDKENGNTTTGWGGLPPYERYILSNGGWNEKIFNDEFSQALGSVDALHDPAVWISGLVALGSSFFETAFIKNPTLLNSESTSKITVLGRYKAYLDLADDIDGNVFNIPTEIYDNLTPDEAWKLNQAFLDEAIARKDTFILASKWAEAVPGSAYYHELQYLFSKGYTISITQYYLIPPNG